MELLTVKEVSKILKVNVNYVYDLIKRGLLPALKLGSWKVRPKTLEIFIEKYECYDLSDLDKIHKSEFYE